MLYLAALDYEHLDNGVFLNSLARSISKQKDVRPVIIHGDSAYTERIIQTGVMREEATIRSMKDLNHRLIALLADAGVSAIGLNGYQRELITLENDTLHLDTDYFERLPTQPVLLLSTLVYHKETGRPKPVGITRLADFLISQLAAEELFIFSASDSDELFTKEQKPLQMQWKDLDESYRNKFIPSEFHNYNKPLRLSTARDFDTIPDLSKTSLIN